jgi:hypothetical protein
MTEIRRADPTARRHATWLLILGALVGSLFIAGFERYRTPLREWLLSDPRAATHRVKLALVLSAALLTAPIVAFAVYFWRFGDTILRARQFPPPRHRVVRDTPVLDGPAAVRRGRAFKILALGLVVASAVLWLLLWRLAPTLAPGAT